MGRLGRDLSPAPSGQMHDDHHACQLADELLHRKSRACHDPPGKVSSRQGRWKEGCEQLMHAVVPFVRSSLSPPTGPRP